jgi:type I restriction enzyme R subunit
MLALNMRNALPNASFIGFTGTPLFKDDEITRRVFGDYVSTYDFQRAVDDKATVPIYYDARGEKLGIALGDLNERIAEKVESLEIEDINVTERLEQALRRDYHIITAEKRLNQIARDFVHHYSNGWESGKAMMVCIDKITCVRMYLLIEFYWQERIGELERELPALADEQEEIQRQRKIAWMRETLMAVVVSEEQGEVEKFRKWDLDILPHRRLIKEGMELPDSMKTKPRFRNMQRMALDDAFKEDEHPFRIVFVCAMWLTGFDVPSLATIYLDKPLKAHTLMQAIARANRVNAGKNNGLIVDYCGILRHLRHALATFAGVGDDGHEGGGGESDPARPNEELLADLVATLTVIRSFLVGRGASLDDVIGKSGFERNAAILAAKEAVNENDESRKRFEVMCRELFKKFKACINIEGVNGVRADYHAITMVYRSLQEDREQADITDIIRQFHHLVDAAIEVIPSQLSEASEPFDISKINFERLRLEFERSRVKCTAVQNLSQAIDNKLRRLMERNPLRTNFQRHYEDIVEAYNREKDRPSIEKTFEELVRLVQELDEEESRAVREGLDEESLAIFDLLKKQELTPQERGRIKKVAKGLLETLKAEKLRIDHWQEKESTRDAVRTAIHDFLWSEATGLPVESYTEEEVKGRSEEIFRHVYRVYPRIPSPFYEKTVAA